MTDRPEDFRYGARLGWVTAVYLDAWEIDVRMAGPGGLLRRASVVGPRFPEVSTPLRPQWVLVWFAGAQEGQAFAQPIAGQLGATRQQRDGFLYYDEWGHFRLSSTHTGVLEIRNTAADDPDVADDSAVCRVRIEETDGIVRIDVGDESAKVAEIILNLTDKSIRIACDEDLTVQCKNAHVVVVEDAEVLVGGNVDLTVGGDVTAAVGGDADLTVVGGVTAVAATVTVTAATVDVTAATTTFNGNVVITGTLVL